MFMLESAAEPRSTRERTFFIWCVQEHTAQDNHVSETRSTSPSLFRSDQNVSGSGDASSGLASAAMPHSLSPVWYSTFITVLRGGGYTVVDVIH